LDASHLRGGTKQTFAPMSATLEGYRVAHRPSWTLAGTDSENPGTKLPATFWQLPATGYRGWFRQLSAEGGPLVNAAQGEPGA
jgi:hypothetical protein